MSTPVDRPPRPLWPGIVRAALLLVTVTAAVFSVEFFRNPQDSAGAPVLTVIWVVALATAAPVVAYVLNRRTPLATDSYRTLVLSVPQLPLLVLLAAVDVWLDVRSGYLLEGSGEESMSYGIGLTLATLFGMVVVLLVAVAARTGAGRAGTVAGRAGALA
ncbi:hypothetical protein [Ornithinimicrobium tianjinense]|uniref:Uncharacterized protein n=1 Tax=Ornithinimicrobium tianjinense TaxID=1195761 RepID=A0A917BH88_9MICO|nr:hypothetical protein [Ornithinimicrobium tianjinense]GGF38999.1 hypothetical protein GCM10011366_03250 [Ornithinimicrobium tianjinense]